MATVAMARMEAIVLNCILNGVDWKEVGLGVVEVLKVLEDADEMLMRN
jgi:hypothetical protein